MLNLFAALAALVFCLMAIGVIQYNMGTRLRVISLNKVFSSKLEANNDRNRASSHAVSNAGAGDRAAADHVADRLRILR